MITYKILGEKGLIVFCLSQQFTMKEAMDFFDDFTKNETSALTFNSIVDIRNAELKMDRTTMLGLFSQLGNTSHFDVPRKVCFLTRTPLQVVFSTMLSLQSSKAKTRVKAYSTISAVLKWLNIENFTEKDYASVLESICSCSCDGDCD